MSRAASRFSVGTWVDVALFSELESAEGGAGVEERSGVGLGPLENRFPRCTQEGLAQVVGSWCLAFSRESA